MNWLNFKTTPPPSDCREMLVYVGGKTLSGHIHLASLRYASFVPEWVATDMNISDPYCHICGNDIDEKILYWMPLPAVPSDDSGDSRDLDDNL